MSINRIALYHLETLLWIDRLGTFGAAADRLNTTQPTVSARIRELENHLGTKLFWRHGRNMQLSIQGRELVKQCHYLWPLIEDILLAPQHYRGATGIVRIGSGEIAAASCLPAFVNEIKAAMPGVNLEIEIDLTTRLIERLLSGTIDLMFAMGPIEMPGITATTIGQIELTWLAEQNLAKKISASEKAKANLAFWSLAKSSPMHSIMHSALKDMGFSQRVVNTCNDVHSLIDIVLAGGGVGLFPMNMVEDKMAIGALKPVFEHVPPPILLQTACREGEIDPIVGDMFRRAASINIA